MPNIWHIWHIKHKNRPSSDVLNMLKLWNMLQYALIFESIRMRMPFPFILFLFIFLSPFSSLYSFDLFSSLSVTLYLFPLSPPCSKLLSSLLKISRRLTSPSTSTAFAADLHSPCHWPLDLLIGSWVWYLGWVSMCGFWVIDWSVGLGFWAGGCGGGWFSFGSAMFVAVVGGGVCGCSGFRCMGFGSLIDQLGWDFGPVVVSWLWQWLVEFWVGDVCGCSGWRCLWL